MVVKWDLLYAPWRHDYINKNREEKSKKRLKKSQCIFCRQFKLNQDEKCLILRRFDNCFVIMNAYPYNIGHLMVLPNQHKADLRDLNKSVKLEVFEVISSSLSVLEESLQAKGFNIGVNLGIAGGGGIPSHLHVHVLPRWIGDTNFFETIGGIKLLSSDIKKVYKILQAEFEKIKVLGK